MPERGKTLLGRFYDEVGAGNLGVIDELVADNYIEHEEFPGLEPNKEGLKQFFSMLHSAFPDLRMEVHELLGDDDLASARVTATGTHEGEFMGLQPGGRRIDVQIFDMVRISDGQVTEHWGVVDAMTLMRQLGAIPEVPG
jgi:predicted ester cyclase